EFRERFIGMLGHDLRTPLGAISFSAATLLKREEAGDQERRAVQRIAACADRMERMIRDLLDFARSRRGSGIPVTPAPSGLARLCRRALGAIGASHPDRAVKLCARGSSHGLWDPDRVAQVIQNLVVN